MSTDDDNPSRRLPHFEHARLYQRLGWRVFPVARLIRGDDGGLRCSCASGAACDAPGKHPMFKGWREDDASVTRWWGAAVFAKPNIGIVTGAESDLVVLDVDPRAGGDHTLAELEARHGRLPDTVCFVTGGGGWHLLFAHPGEFIKSGAGRLGPGLDVKADGGLIVAPPSRHRSGRRYQIDPAHHPADVPLAPLPEWLRERLTRREQRVRPERPVRPSSGLSRYGEAALSNACDRIVRAHNGSQELTINAEAFSIGRLAGAGAVPAIFALHALQYAAQRCASYDGSRPWDGSQLSEKVRRSFDAGMASPGSVRR